MVKVEDQQPAQTLDQKSVASDGMHAEFTEVTLPRSIGTLFELNNYEVEYSKKVNGAEVDIVAKSKGDPFAPTIYIEATIQYVDNTKYGKDTTKFLLIKAIDQRGICLCISSRGFTPDVKERANASGIRTQLYSELFSSFEKFSPYADHVLGDASINALLDTYEEPLFRDSQGEELATTWLREWKRAEQTKQPWLVVLGEYGTGKTALTQKIQSDWINDYVRDPSEPIPFRVELRSFTRQFDARSLIHHFLDSNHLGHVPIDFVFHLIRSKRVILILDGYDEMAQFLNARERRTCLATLAELASAGAKGILTSRPNYFTETEELHVFEALYTSLERNKYYISQIDRLYIAGERSVDELLENYLLNKNERYLRDLTPEQTTALVRRKLANDSAGQGIVISLLNKIFREEVGGTRQALSGKPVIISYLLELIEELRASTGEQEPASLTEWQIYKLIVDRLMLRDLQRSPALAPEDRRGALQKLALTLSRKEIAAANEEVFANIINENFKASLRRLSPEDRRAKQEELFQDLRSSATLTRTEAGGQSGWIFSHNSLREFLVAELCVGSIMKGVGLDATFPITAPMRSFVASAPTEISSGFIGSLQAQWVKRQIPNLGLYLSLGIELLAGQEGGFAKALQRVIGKPSGGLDFESITLRDLDLSTSTIDKKKLLVHAKAANFIEISFKALDLTNSDFSSSVLDRVILSDCTLNGCSFSSAIVFECDLSNALVAGADFTGLDKASNFVVKLMGESVVLTGPSAIGWLRFHGAETDAVPAYIELQHHSKFSIVLKICENIADQKNSQIRGLTQRGAAQADTNFAREFLSHLKNADIISVVRNELVTATSEGRKKLTRFVNHQDMPVEIEGFLRAHKSS